MNSDISCFILGHLNQRGTCHVKKLCTSLGLGSIDLLTEKLRGTAVDLCNKYQLMAAADLRLRHNRRPLKKIISKLQVLT